MTGMPRVEQALHDYLQALNALPQPGDSEAAAKALTLLLARDELANALLETPGQDHSTMALICELDQRLKNKAAVIDTAVGRSTLASFRESIHPLKAPWWWRLDEQAAAAEPGANPLWTIPAALLFVLSLSVIADTITTLRNGGLNRLSVFGTLMQTVLALIAGSTFLASGREWLEELFAKFRINRKIQGGLRVVFALALFALTLGISVLLPYLVARYRNHEGHGFFTARQYADAAQSFQQAVSLDPSFMRDRFMLALAYDRARDYPNAIREYELSLQFNPNNYKAANNLARLYILQTKNYDGALRLLKPFIENLKNMPAPVSYHLFKNRGWAYLELHHVEQATDDLTWALTKQDAGTANYLLGRALAEQGKAAEAKAQWNAFIQFTTRKKPLDGTDDQLSDEFEPGWVAHAYEQLLKGEGQ